MNNYFILLIRKWYRKNINHKAHDWVIKWLGINTIIDRLMIGTDKRMKLEAVVSKQEETLHRYERHLKQLIDNHKSLGSMGVDLHFKGQSQIVVISKLNGGQIRFIDCPFSIYG